MITLLLSGKRFSGKDTVCSVLQTLFPEKRIKAFASAYECKRLYCEKNSLNVADFAKREFKEARREALTQFYHASTSGGDGNGGNSVVFEEIFAKEIAKSAAAAEFDIAVVTDWRFERQFALAKLFLPRVPRVRIRIEASDEARKRRGWTPNEAIDKDATETSLDDADFDIVLRNDSNDIDDLRASVAEHVVPLLRALLQNETAFVDDNFSPLQQNMAVTV